jgi:hypothetical protein
MRSARLSLIHTAPSFIAKHLQRPMLQRPDDIAINDQCYSLSCLGLYTIEQLLTVSLLPHIVSRVTTAPRAGVGYTGRSPRYNRVAAVFSGKHV